MFVSLLRDGCGWQPCFYSEWVVTGDCVPSVHHSFSVLQEPQHNFCETCMGPDLGAAEETNCRYIFMFHQRPLVEIYPQFLVSQGTFTAHTRYNLQNKIGLNVCI